MSTLKPGDICTLTITDIAYLGAGVARTEGYVVFVPGVCLGETVRVRLTRVKKRFANAVLLDVLTASDARLQPPECRLPDGTTVPGCTYGHMTYAAEIEAKQNQLRAFLTRQVGIPGETLDSLLLPPVASPGHLHYRNKIVLHAGESKGYRTLGYRGDDNRTVIDIPQCPLAAEPINQELARLRADNRFLDKLRTGQNLTLRWTPADGVRHWLDLPPRETFLTETLSIGDLTVSAGGFFQVNIPATDALLRFFMERFAVNNVPKAHAIDLYCGVGLFACAAAAAGAERISGVEHNSDAIHCARKNVAARGLNAVFTCAASESIPPNLLTRFRPDETTLIVDPPREGLADAVVQTILTAPPAALFYISCSPDTLARDLKKLLEGGYRPVCTRLFDFFPRTSHFETLIQLERS